MDEEGREGVLFFRILLIFGCVIIACLLISIVILLSIEREMKENSDNNQNNNVENQSGINDINEKDIICDIDSYNCPDFATKEIAQKVLDYCKNKTDNMESDIHSLDLDKDGKACE